MQMVARVQQLLYQAMRRRYASVHLAGVVHSALKQWTNARASHAIMEAHANLVPAGSDAFVLKDFQDLIAVSMSMNAHHNRVWVERRASMVLAASHAFARKDAEERVAKFVSIHYFISIYSKNTHFPLFL